MEAGNGAGDPSSSRLDRIEAIMDTMAADHEQFRQEHKMLLRAQVIMQNTMERIAEKHERLAEAQRNSEEKLNVLLATVDDWIRRH
ncbi:MAG: hypothetical protein M3Z09_15365 [Acidobacteriota bacterium]|nr:hypothetical protein [Acidobacteriota bacterium]